ncbi:MAG: ABC transporter ATP-binding protein [Bacillota bacterium]|nr:ABC transporter ATP-binding protein [Bacillota bacterium]
MTRIKVDGVWFDYGSGFVLRGVTLNISDKAFNAMIGPNGSGKTTLLRCITGYLKPQKGKVELDGRDVAHYPAKELARLMALIPQQSFLGYDFTVKDVVLMGRNPYISRFRSLEPEDERLADEAMKRTEIYELRDRSVLGISGGEWQRLVIARALAQQSPILILDEPVAHLDIKHQANIMRLVRELIAENGITVICVLHDLNMTLRFADRLAVLKKGELVAYGEPEKVLSHDAIRRVYETEVKILEMKGSKYIVPDWD